MLPGQFAPCGTGTMGDLSRLDTQNPVLYLRFPQGRMKLQGTLLYPKCKYLSMRVGNKKLFIEDVFESIILFTETFWIGSAEENPEEIPMSMPRALQQHIHVEHTYQGGASRASQDEAHVPTKIACRASVEGTRASSEEALREASEESVPEASPKRGTKRTKEATRSTKNKRRHVRIEGGSSEESTSICAEEEEDPDYEL